MKSCKALSWLFPIITNTGLFFKRRHRKVKRDHISQSFDFSPFDHVGKSRCPFLSESQKLSFPSVPQGTWEKVGISLCWQHCVSVFHYIPAAIESQSGTIPRMVSRISIQNTKKRIQSKWMIGLVSLLWYGVWTAESRANSHRRCWGRWSMRWCRSSPRAVGWSIYFFPPKSDCFCWRPVENKNQKIERRKGKESVRTCLQHMD